MDNYKILVNHLKEKREERGMSQKELGEVLGVGYQTISHYENLRRKPSLEKFEKWLNEFGLELNVEWKEENKILELFNKIANKFK